MQISGRLVIVAMFVLAISMAAGAWLYQYSYSRRSAEFWGESSRLIGKSPELQFLVLESTPAEGDASGDDQTNAVAGRPVTDYHDLRNEKGLIHLRHVFIQDDNFSWGARQVEPAASTRDWAYALRFVEGPSEQVVLLGRDFKVLGKLSTDGKQVDVLPCPRIATPLQRYLTDVGALKPKAKSDAEPTVAAESAAR
jgi:hypothetical protein